MFKVVKSNGMYCANPGTERMAQTVRLTAGTVGGPLVVYAASKLDDQYTSLRTTIGLVGLATTVWNLMAWSAVKQAGGPTGFGRK
tara:strand:+ start:313 stop:567 length:255 start_codon:yes stop_codon:yes gene_type:complete